ncbi:helix-turn-helix domain-containing protein [Microbispora sp. CSR-4]|uniref:helix-turn-helix domain-containing protein n=1 Tax=Microbispora sp. CSR-4 TaxID=2592813 RepID=UPI00164FDE3E|nr:helix-turn-helix domain-containing protein [Microbispora sp. CSR-4]
MERRSARYVEGAALVWGFGAHVVDRVLATYLPKFLQTTPMLPEQRAAIEETRAAIARASDVYLTWPVAVDGSAETPVAEIEGPSPGEEITTAEAAVLLGVTERRVRQLADHGLGQKVGRQWVYDRAVVLAWRDERRTA